MKQRKKGHKENEKEKEGAERKWNRERRDRKKMKQRKKGQKENEIEIEGTENEIIEEWT